MRLPYLLLLGVVLYPVMADAQPRWLAVPATPALPDAMQSGYVERKDARLWYATYGTTNKPVVLLLHGGGGSSDYWSHLIRELERDHRVVVFDCRGQGRSTNEAAAISYEQMADDAIAVLDRLGIKHSAVVGWSDGANIGFYLALKHPERVSALIAFAGNATPAGYQPNTNPSTMAAYVSRTRAEYRKLSPRPEQFETVSGLLSAMWRTQPALRDGDLAKITVRTAIFHAEHDEIIRRDHSQYLAKQIPGAALVLLRGVSHFALLQDAEGFNGAVRAFLTAQ
jgi:pimeloyl-ACP methyl ester carboxylesterase